VALAARAQDRAATGAKIASNFWQSPIATVNPVTGFQFRDPLSSGLRGL
jgi:hypothetical protein